MRLRNSLCMAFKKNAKFPFQSCPTLKEFLIHSIAQIYERIYKDGVINVYQTE